MEIGVQKVCKVTVETKLVWFYFAFGGWDLVTTHVRSTPTLFQCSTTEANRYSFPGERGLWCQFFLSLPNLGYAPPLLRTYPCPPSTPGTD